MRCNLSLETSVAGGRIVSSYIALIICRPYNEINVKAIKKFLKAREKVSTPAPH